MEELCPVSSRAAVLQDDDDDDDDAQNEKTRWDATCG